MITSKFLSLNAQDFLKGLAVATFAPVAPIVGDTINAWIENGFGPLVFDWQHIWQAAVAAAFAYIQFKFFSKAKQVKPIE